jgi:hypothetical protein
MAPTASKKLPNFLAPDALLAFFVALMLDLGGVICLLLDLTIILSPIGLVVSQILDILGLIFFSLWTMQRGGSISGKASHVLKKLLKRVGLPMIVELIPIVGDLAFSWVVTVYLEISKNE